MGREERGTGGKDRVVEEEEGSVIGTATAAATLEAVIGAKLGSSNGPTIVGKHPCSSESEREGVEQSRARWGGSNVVVIGFVDWPCVLVDGHRASSSSSPLLS